MQKNNLDETTNLLLNNEYSLNDNDEVDEEIEYKNIKKKKEKNITNFKNIIFSNFIVCNIYFFIF